MLVPNNVYLFKSRLPQLASFVGQGKIFTHTLCTGRINAYGVHSVNKIFEDGINTDQLQARLISLMCSLQKFHPVRGHSMPEWMAKYAGAHEEYPQHYEALVSGLSAKALNMIAKHTVPYAGDNEEETGATFEAQLLIDKNTLLPASAPKSKLYELIL